MKKTKSIFLIINHGITRCYLYGNPLETEGIKPPPGFPYLNIAPLLDGTVLHYILML